MVGLDTNILVRYLAQDDRAQSARATRIIEHELTEDNPGFVCVVAIVETAWVLERSYGLTAREVALAVEAILQTDVLVVECEQEVFAATVALRSGIGSFADALIGALGKRQNCVHTLTFDTRASQLPDFALVR